MQKLDHPLIGARIQLVYTSATYTLLRPRNLGYVRDVDDANIIHVEWDNGSSLGLIPGVDSWQIVKERNKNP